MASISVASFLAATFLLVQAAAFDHSMLRFYDWTDQNDPNVKSLLPTTNDTNVDWPITNGRTFGCETCQALLKMIEHEAGILAKEHRSEYGSSDIAIEEAALPDVACELNKWNYLGNHTEVMWGRHMRLLCVTLLEEYGSEIIDLLSAKKTFSDMVKLLCVKEKLCKVQEVWEDEKDLPARRPIQTERLGELSARFMEKNANKTDVEVRPSGYHIKVMQSADPEAVHPSSDDSIIMTYNVTYLNGIMLDSSASNETGQVMGKVSELLPGLRAAVLEMGKGSDWIIYLPPKLAYGERGEFNRVNGNMTVIFRVKLVDVIPSSHLATTNTTTSSKIVDDEEYDDDDDDEYDDDEL